MRNFCYFLQNTHSCSLVIFTEEIFNGKLHFCTVSQKQILLFLLDLYEILPLLSKQYYRIALRQLPLRSPTKTIIIWNSKQIKTLYSQWFGVVLWSSLSEKKNWIFQTKYQRWSPVFIKSWGNESNLSDFSRPCTKNEVFH